MSNWKIVRDRIDNEVSDNPTGISLAKSLQGIIDVAEGWGISSEAAERSNISNLCELVVEAKKAIKEDNQARLFLTNFPNTGT